MVREASDKVPFEPRPKGGIRMSPRRCAGRGGRNLRCKQAWQTPLSTPTLSSSKIQDNEEFQLPPHPESPARAQLILPITNCRVCSLKLRISPEPLVVAHGLTNRCWKEKWKNEEQRGGRNGVEERKKYM